LCCAGKLKVAYSISLAGSIACAAFYGTAPSRENHRRYILKEIELLLEMQDDAEKA
jgi:hypothetical protein